MTITAFPLQAAGVTFGQEPTYQLLDHLVGTGVVTGLVVAQRAAGANMSVDVSAGAAYVAVTNGGKRMFLNGASSNSGTPGTPGADWSATFTAAHATLPRVDRVVAQVRDNVFDSSTFYDGKLRVVAGTATAGATLANLTGAPAVPAGCEHVAYVLVPAAATTIATANIANAKTGGRIGAGAAKLQGRGVVGIKSGATITLANTATTMHSTAPTWTAYVDAGQGTVQYDSATGRLKSLVDGIFRARFSAPFMWTATDATALLLYRLYIGGGYDVQRQHRIELPNLGAQTQRYDTFSDEIIAPMSAGGYIGLELSSAAERGSIAASYAMSGLYMSLEYLGPS